MISGANGPARTSKMAPIVTGPVQLMELGDLDPSPDGVVPGSPSDVGEALKKGLARTKFASKFEAARQTLKASLLSRGMTPYFPRSLAGPLVDPILGRHRGTEEGWRLVPRVDTHTFDFGALATRRDIGSPLMYKAFEGAMEAASRYVTVGEYVAIVSNAFMGDPETAVLWHMLGWHYDPYVSEGALQPGVADLVDVVKGAKLMALINSSEKWRVDLGNVMTAGAAMDPTLQAALTNLVARKRQPTVTRVLDVAADAFMNGVDEPDDDDYKVEPLHPDNGNDPTLALKIRI